DRPTTMTPPNLVTPSTTHWSVPWRQHGGTSMPPVTGDLSPSEGGKWLSFVLVFFRTLSGTTWFWLAQIGMGCACFSPQCDQRIKTVKGPSDSMEFSTG